MNNQKFKILRVTMTKDYIIEMHDETRTHINGWTIEEVVEDWFKCNEKMLECHATRDGSRIGNSKRYVKHEIIDPVKK